MKSSLDKIVDCAHSHFAWDSTDSPETSRHIEAFREKVKPILANKNRGKIAVSLCMKDWRDLVNFVGGDLANMPEDDEIKIQMARISKSILENT